MKIRRCKLMVPANVRKFVEKAREIDADIIQFCIEDAIPNTHAAKEGARADAVRAIREGGFRARELCARVNDIGTPWFLDDVRAVIDAGVDCIKLDHVRGLADVLFAEGYISELTGGRGLDIILGLDVPSAVLELEQIAARSRFISAIAVDPGDYALMMGISLSGPWLTSPPPGVLSRDVAVDPLRQRVLLVARAHGWNAMDAPPSGDPRDLDAMAEAMRRSKSLGFDGCQLAYPGHVPVANAVFSPSEEESLLAERIIAAFEGIDPDRSVAIVDGRGVQPPVYQYHRRIRAFAEALSAGAKEYPFDPEPGGS